MQRTKEHLVRVLFIFLIDAVMSIQAVRPWPFIHNIIRDPTNLQKALSGLLQDAERRPLKGIRVGALLLAAVARRRLARARVTVVVLLLLRRCPLPLSAAATPLAAGRKFGIN